MSRELFTRHDLEALLVQECPHKGFYTEVGKSYCQIKRTEACEAEVLKYNCPDDCPRLMRRNIMCEEAECKWVRKRVNYYIKHREYNKMAL